MPLQNRPTISRPAIIALAALGATLNACGGGEEKTDLSRLDAKLTENSVDPALREAVEAPIATDPDLTGEANRDAVRPPDRPLIGALPVRLTVPQARAEALRLAGGRLIEAPMATRTVTSTGDPLTLGGKLAARLDRGACDRVRVDYGTDWAMRLPPALPLYPGANLIEAAGTDEKSCKTRAVSFTTGTAPDEVLDFYYSMVRRAHYSAEHIEQNGEDVLSGKDQSGSHGYYLSVRTLAAGGAKVDLVTDHGG